MAHSDVRFAQIAYQGNFIKVMLCTIPVELPASSGFDRYTIVVHEQPHPGLGPDLTLVQQSTQPLSQSPEFPIITASFRK